MKRSQITVAAFSDLEKAQKVKKHLVEAGIHAEIYEESKLQKYWFMSKPLGADKVVVDHEDFDKARLLLQAADEQDHVLMGEVRCLQCGSADVEYPQFTRKFMTTTLVEVFVFCVLLTSHFIARIAITPGRPVWRWTKRPTF